MYEIAKTVSSCTCYNVVTSLLENIIYIDGFLFCVSCVIVAVFNRCSAVCTYFIDSLC